MADKYRTINFQRKGSTVFIGRRKFAFTSIKDASECLYAVTEALRQFRNLTRPTNNSAITKSMFNPWAGVVPVGEGYIDNIRRPKSSEHKARQKEEASRK